jgi:hypothetical protein
MVVVYFLVHFPGGNEENHQEAQSAYLMPQPTLKMSISEIAVRSVTP